MRPGDLVMVDPVDRGTETSSGSVRVVLTKTPDGLSVDNPTTGTLEHDEVGLLIALVEVETKATKEWQVGGKHLEALVLFGERLGWNSASCFSVV